MRILRLLPITRVLKKLPKWTIVVLVLILVAFMASNFVQHASTRSRGNERRDQIRQRQQEVFQSIGRLPDDERPVRMFGAGQLFEAIKAQFD